jgi:hypothetical protein
VKKAIPKYRTDTKDCEEGKARKLFFLFQARRSRSEITDI